MSETITDAAGRKLEVKTLTPLERIKFIKALGGAADSQTYIGNVIISAMVRSIDGVPVVMPRTSDQADSVYGQVGDDGMKAVSDWFVAAQEAAAFDKEAAKNLPTSQT